MNRALSSVLCYAIGMVAYCVCATCLGASSDPVTKIDFSEDGLKNKVPVFGLDDAGNSGQTSNTYWWSPATNGNYSIIRDYVGRPYHSFDETTNPQPSYMADDTDNVGLLDFNLSELLYRTFSLVDSNGTSTATTYYSTYDVFIDQLVQFTTRDEAASESIAAFLPTDAKFACWVASGTNKLIITAGRYAADNTTLYAANYISTMNVETGRWYRLTVRSIKSATTKVISTVDPDQKPGLAVYLDGVQVTCGEDYAVGDDPTVMDDWYRGNFHYVRRGLFPSLTTTPKVRGLAMLGEGKFDEFGLSKQSNPLSAGSTTELDFYVAVDTNAITNVTVSVDGEEVTQTSNQEMTRVTVHPKEKVSIAVLTADGYAVDKLKKYGNEKAIKSVNGFEVTMASGTTFADSEPVGVRVNVTEANFVVDGTSYESVKDAMKAANKSASRRFTLYRDLVIGRDPVKGAGQVMVLPEYTIVFDLHGHKLRGDHFKEEAAIYTQGRLTVIDTIGGGAIIAPGTAIEVAASNTALEVNYEQAALTLGDREYPADFTVTGRVVCTKGELTLKGGTYVTPPDLMPTNRFYLEQYVAAERYQVSNNLARCSTPGAVWTVAYDGRFRVGFEAEHGLPAPTYTNINTAAGAYLSAPAITNAAGYTVTNWYVKGTEPQLNWDLANDEVTNDMTLVAQQRLDVYAITYAKAYPTSDWPTEYSVETALTTLPTPAKTNNYNFTGWVDLNTLRAVTAIGAGAKWPGTDELVTGNLQLEAQWQPDVLQWTNIGSYSSESNGYYASTWRFTIPTSATLTSGQEIVIDEINFALVNPLTLPKSADFLAITPYAGSTVVSATRPVGYDSVSGEYAAATNTMANGRVRLAYRFTDLVVKAGEDNVAQFSTTAGTVTPVTDSKCFLRLAVKPTANDAVFGNCTEPEEYLIYCPVYEVFGHVKGDVE